MLHGSTVFHLLFELQIPYLDIIALFRRIISVDSTDTSRYATESCICKQSFALDMTLISINPLWQHFKILAAINWIFTWSLLSSWISTNLTRSSSRVWWRKYKEGCAWCDMLPLVNPKSNNSELGLFVESHAVTGNSFAIFFHHMFISYHILLHNSIIVPNSTKSKMYLFFISDLMRLCQQMRLRIWNRLQIYLLLLQSAWMYPLVRYSTRQIMLYFFQCYTCRMVWSYRDLSLNALLNVAH